MKVKIVLLRQVEIERKKSFWILLWNQYKLKRDVAWYYFEKKLNENNIFDPILSAIHL